MTAPTLALQDRRAVAAASQCEFREGWSFKGKPEPVIDRMIGATPGPIIHGCCGAARLVREDNCQNVKFHAKSSAKPGVQK